MSQQRELLTDRLVSVISSIQRERGSGVLMVKRGEGNFLEEGTIVFVNGQITEARTGRLRDSGARNLLSTWEHCRYLFMPSSSEVGVGGSLPTLSVEERETDPLSFRSPAHMSNTSRPDPLTPTPSSLGLQEGQRDASDERTPYLLQHHNVALRFIEQQELSRAHRQLIFLIDGRRSIGDLARLTRKRGSELYRLLEDLERAHVIRIT
jgi:hypothetical protein